VTLVISGVVRATRPVVPQLIIFGLALWSVCMPFANMLQPRFGIDAIWWRFAVSALAGVTGARRGYCRPDRKQARSAPKSGHAPSQVAGPAE